MIFHVFDQSGECVQCTQKFFWDPGPCTPKTSLCTPSWTGYVKSKRPARTPRQFLKEMCPLLYAERTDMQELHAACDGFNKLCTPKLASARQSRRQKLACTRKIFPKTAILSRLANSSSSLLLSLMVDGGLTRKKVFTLLFAFWFTLFKLFWESTIYSATSVDTNTAIK